MKFPDFTSTFDFHKRSQCPNRFCRVHYYYDFDTGYHESFPHEWVIKTSTQGWLHVTVFCGPGAWYPRKPEVNEWLQIRMVCPHSQLDLTCNTCLRHMFRPIEI